MVKSKGELPTGASSFFKLAVGEEKVICPTFIK